MRFLYNLIILIPCIFGANKDAEEITQRLLPISSATPFFNSSSIDTPLLSTFTTSAASYVATTQPLLSIECAATLSTRDTSQKVLLSLNGGGVRGLMLLKMLAAQEKKAGTSIINLVSGMSGTSIGGVIACVLTMPDPLHPTLPKYSPQNLLDFFTANKDRFFVSKWQSMNGLFGTRYKTTSLKNMLLELLGDNKFSNRLLPVVLTANDIQLERARFFSSTGSEDFYTRDIAMATAAAPTYFKPQNIVPLNSASHPGYWLTDGGTFMNHPVAAGKRLIHQLYGVEQDEIIILALGTGTLGDIKNIERLKRGGMLAWAPVIANICIAGSSTSDHYDAMYENGKNYHYLSPLIGEHNAALDDTSQANINALMLASQRTIEEPDFNRVTALIAANYALKTRLSA